MGASRTIETPVGAEVTLDGARYVNFGGASYLGLSAIPQIIEAGSVALREFGCRDQFARHYHIANRALQDAELEGAKFFGTQSAVHLAAGYNFGFAAIAAVRNDCGAIFYDEWSHYSLREAIAASGLPSFPFRHLEPEDLSVRLKRHLGPGSRPLIVTDGLFSTLGQIAPLNELWRLAAAYDGRLVVDESHSFGVLGERGCGAGEHHNIPACAAIIGGSTGKGFGVAGCIIPASESDASLVRSTPVLRGSAGAIPAAAAMCAESFRYVRHHPELMERLRSNARYLKKGLRGIGLSVDDSDVPIAAFVTQSGEDMSKVQERLMVEGLFVLHSTYIGSGPGGVIRCCTFADHTHHHIDHLIDGLARVL